MRAAKLVHPLSREQSFGDENIFSFICRKASNDPIMNVWLGENYGRERVGSPVKRVIPAPEKLVRLSRDQESGKGNGRTKIIR